MTTRKTLYNTKLVWVKQLKTEHIAVKWLLNNEKEYYINKATKEIYSTVKEKFEGLENLTITELNQVIREIHPELYIKVTTLNKKIAQVWKEKHE